jgi:two-component system, LytTR family, sensor kinase
LQHADIVTNRPAAFTRSAWHCVALLWCLLPVTAFTQQYNFDYINIKNGLVNNTVRSIYQDKKGIMYFGTNSGVSIYYGNAFKNMDQVNGKKIGIINQIVGSPDDSIYVIASTMPFFYQLQGQRLEKHATNAPVYIYSMLYDDGRFLVCADDGLRVFEQGQFKKMKLVTRDTIKYISKIISCNEHLWLIGRLGGSMELVNKKTLQTTAISPALTATQFYKDAQNNIWIATKDKGVLYLSAAGIADNKLQLSPVPPALDFLSSSEINDITGDREGNIYFATVGKGLVKMSPGKQVEIINTRSGLSSLHVRTAFVDREGNLWVGTNMGIDKLSVNRLNIYNDRFGLQSNICYDAALYKNRFLITPNNLGFSVIDDKNKSIINYPLRVENESYPFRTTIAGEKIYVLNKNTVSVVNDAFSGGRPYTSTTSFPGRINILTTDNKKNILVGGMAGVWQLGAGKPSLLISEPDVRTIIVDEKDVLWIGRYDNGIACYQLTYGSSGISTRKLAQWKTGYNQDHSRILLKGNNNTVWYGSRFSGLYQLQLKDTMQLLKHFDAQTGLSSDFVQSLCLLPSGKLLAGTADGMDMIDVPAFYAVSTAVHKKFNFSSKINQIKLSDDGRLWMATDDGILNLDISQLENGEKNRAALLITAVKAKDIDNSNLTEQHNFKYNNNTLTFWFASPTYITENNMLYTWRLQGSSDTAWSEPVQTNTASFTDINPGKYIFHVKMLDGPNGNAVSTAQYEFVIRKPFWKQYWFIALLVVAAAFVLYRLIKAREKNIAEREAQKTELQKLKADNYQYQLEIEQVVSYFASSINQKNSIDELLWDVARNCIARLGFEDCVIYLVDEERKVLVQKAAWGHKSNSENSIINPIDIPVGRGIVGAVAKSGRAEIVADTGKDYRYLIDDDVRLSEITVPIIDNGKVIGVIDSEHPEKNFYTDRHLQILITIASLCADKIDKINAERLTREKEIEVLKLQKDLATSQLTTLRAQMNPHFIFNALNSIQQYILQGNGEEASRYLSRFSKLQREILNNSSQQFISLEKETELLTLYLQLEELRFGHTFTYQVTTGSNMDTAEIRIPTMIIQPFIENAIWHGLMAKTGDKKLTIDFALAASDFLVCTIRDNGIGREASARLKEVRPGQERHQSKGLSLVYDRLGMLQQQYKQSFKAEVSDIMDSNSGVAGTQVVLTMYISH